jgi:hypothetical protein
MTTMKTLLRAASLIAATAAAVHAQAVVGRNEERYTIREPLTGGQQLHLTTPNGTITIVQGSGAEVEIRAEKRTNSGGSIEEIGFMVRRSESGVAVCAVYDDDSSCDMEDGYRERRRGGGDSWRRRRASVNFTVTMPADVRVRASSGNGDISINGAGSVVEVATGNGRVLVNKTTGRVKASTGNGVVTVQDVRGEVQANTGNGDISVSTSDGPVTARSGNGDINVSMERLERAEDMQFSTGSGRIVVALPANFGAEMDASTGNGTIRSDIPVRVEGRITPYRMRGTLGNGGDRLSLSTGNGDIEIRRAP